MAFGAAVLVTLAMAGCGNPAGVDGDLTDDWAVFPAPVGFVPVADTCHLPLGGHMSGRYQQIDCAELHSIETIHVGTFPATVTALPKPGDTAMHVAYAECAGRSTEWLGGDWREALLYLDIATPTSAAWGGGARWFRCDLNQVGSLLDDSVRQRTGSLKGALKTDSDLRYGCYKPTFTGDAITAYLPKRCDEPHRVEFIGIHEVTYRTLEEVGKADGPIHRACLSLIAKYAKVPDNADMQYRTGTTYPLPSKAEWDLGNRGIRCMVYLDRDLTRSIRGGGGRVLPVR